MKSGAYHYFQTRFLCIAVFFVTMLLFLFPADARAESHPEANDDIRVRLSVADCSKLVIPVEGRYRVGDTSFVGGTLTVTARNGGIRIRHDALGELARSDSAEVLREEETVWAAFLTLENERYGKCRYLGDMLFLNDGSNRLIVINRVGIRAYLYGVVGGELRNTHPTEALKAQTVAAKCYALTRLDANADFDLDDTPTDQVYKGYHPAHENVIAAVDAVADDVLLYDGEIVCCYYCTSNGGQTITPLMRWGNHSGQDAVFQMTYDPYDLMGSEDAVTLPVGSEAAALPDAFYALLQRLAQAENPAVTQVDTVLSMLGLHDKDDPDGSYDAPTALAPHAWIAVQLACRTADGTWITVDCGFSPDLLLQEGIVSAPKANLSYLRPETDGSWTFVFSHAVGHRVGMSHEGLLARAEAGFRYDEILLWYYPGAQLIRGTDPAAAQPPLTEQLTHAATAAPEPEAAPTPPAPTATPEPALVPYEDAPTLWERLFGI